MTPLERELLSRLLLAECELERLRGLAVPLVPFPTHPVNVPNYPAGVSSPSPAWAPPVTHPQ